MKLVQFYDPKKGYRAGILEGECIFPVCYEQKQIYTILDLVDYATSLDLDLDEVAEETKASEPLAVTWSELNIPPDMSKLHLALPIHAPEVWACGVTYKRSAEFRDGDTQLSKGIYDSVYFATRPELFFKGRAGHCTGPNDMIGLRIDSQFTAVEPELAILINSRKKILGFLIANDVSAWDIERENPLYLPQSKIFRACCALGPVIVTRSAISDPYALGISCVINRSGKNIFSGKTSLGMMKRTIEELIDFLFRSNTVPSGTILLTGTGIIQTQDAALQEGDVIEITIPEIGTLRNIARQVI